MSTCIEFYHDNISRLDAYKRLLNPDLVERQTIRPAVVWLALGVLALGVAAWWVAR